jgi:hypothetical protein
MSVSTQLTFESLCNAPADTLEELVQRGTPPSFEDLVGWEWRGYNTNPGSELLRIRKFKKGFYEDPGTPEVLQGYNVRIAQNGLLNPWVDKLHRGEPIREFYFEALHATPSDRHPNSLYINYAIRGKLPVDPSRFLKDYVVHPYPENTDLLLGRAYYALGPVWIPISYLVLERYNKAL